jgi:hypothetical protein
MDCLVEENRFDVPANDRCALARNWNPAFAYFCASLWPQNLGVFVPWWFQMLAFKTAHRAGPIFYLLSHPSRPSREIPFGCGSSVHWEIWPATKQRLKANRKREGWGNSTGLRSTGHSIDAPRAFTSQAKPHHRRALRSTLFLFVRPLDLPTDHLVSVPCVWKCARASSGLSSHRRETQKRNLAIQDGKERDENRLFHF